MEQLIAFIVEKNKRKVVLSYEQVKTLLKKQRLSGVQFRSVFIPHLKAVGIDCDIVKDMVVFTVNDEFFYSV